MDDMDDVNKIVSENKTLVCGKQYIGTANYTFIFAVIAYNYSDLHFLKRQFAYFAFFHCRKLYKITLFQTEQSSNIIPYMVQIRLYPIKLYPNWCRKILFQADRNVLSQKNRRKKSRRKSAERDIWRLDGTKTRRFQPPVDAWLIRSDAVRTRSGHDGSASSCFFRPERMVT